MEGLSEALAERRNLHLLRTLAPVVREEGVSIRRDGRRLVDFASNDYLALSREPSLVAAAHAALDGWGLSASGSRLMSGDLELHHELEAEVAALKRREAALVFGTGYQANLGIVTALAGRNDLVIADALSHASQIDGAILSRARLLRFRHGDPEHLAFLLERHRGEYRRALILCESVYSMDGDLAPLEALVRVKDRHRAILAVDEAHATGVFGPRGAGRVVERGLEDAVEVTMGTFGKALGGFGAFVAARRVTIDWLVNAARPFIYSTALPPPTVAGNLAAIRLLALGPERGPALLARAAAFREALRADGHVVLGESQIVPVIAGTAERALSLAAACARAGLQVPAIRPPTVPEGTSRLRVSLSSAHADEDLARLREALRG